MASTYTLISSNVLSSSAASVTFSSIPATYTDLVLRLSTRTDSASPTGTLKINFNNDSTTLYSFTRIRADGATASSGSSTGDAYSYGGLIDGDTATADTFASSEIYVPSYTISQNRPISVFTAQENNSATAYLHVMANLYRSTTIISRIDLAPVAGNFKSGSSFYLYGVKNS